MSNQPTPETDALAERLIPIAANITESNAQDIIKQVLIEILVKTTALERERDEAREQYHQICSQTLFEINKAHEARDEAREERDIARLSAQDADKAHDRMVGELEKVYKERDEAREALRTLAEHGENEIQKLIKERDEARNKMADALQEELSSIHRWVERHNQDGFDDKLTHRQNIDICYDLLYDRLDMAELELNRIKRAVIATLDENRHLADGMNCTLIKLKTVVPTWK